jgi:hypothetical protein
LIWAIYTPPKPSGVLPEHFNPSLPNAHVTQNMTPLIASRHFAPPPTQPLQNSSIFEHGKRRTTAPGRSLAYTYSRDTKDAANIAGGVHRGRGQTHSEQHRQAACTAIKERHMTTAQALQAFSLVILGATSRGDKGAPPYEWKTKAFWVKLATNRV